MTKDAVEQVPILVRDLYRIVQRLEALFPYRKFTLDGHLVGSIGEVLAAHKYDLELLPASSPVHDARSSDGHSIQIKATQTNSVGLRRKPEILLVLRLMPDGTTQEIYNGPGHLAWDHSGKMQSNGQRKISTTRLANLMDHVMEGQGVRRGRV